MSFLGFSTVGFSGSRSLSGQPFAQVRALATFAQAAGASVLTGCAPGADAAARLGAPSAHVFSVQAFPGIPPAARFARRSIAFAQALAASPAPVLLAFPAASCPVGLVPSSKPHHCFSGFGSGTWATAALVAGLGVPVFVFFPRRLHVPPHRWGGWLAVTSGTLAGSWQLIPRK